MVTNSDPRESNSAGLAGLLTGQSISVALRNRRKLHNERTFPLDEEQLRLSEGWDLVRYNQGNSVRLRKEKPDDEKLEDEVWRLFAGMRFDYLNADRQFKIAVDSAGSGVPPKQIDVFAADDETAIVAECKAASTLRSRSLQKDLNETRGLQDAIRQTIHTTLPGSRRRVIFLYATRNIDWSEPDQARAKENQIAVLRDSLLDYYAKLVSILGPAARYQLLGDLLSGSPISGLNERVSAVRGRFGSNRFYQFTIEPEKLLKLVYVNHRGSSDDDPIGTYQRLLSRKRLKDIAEHIERHRGGIFPTNVVVNFSGRVRFDPSGPADDDEPVVGTLYLPNRYRSAFLIDGQHRLYGFARTEFAAKGKIPVLAFEGLKRSEEVNMFVDINSKQVRVPKRLLVELEPEILDPNAGPRDRLRQLNSRVAANVATRRSSPMYDLVAGEWGPDSSRRPITRPTLRDAVGESRIVGTIAGGAFDPGPLYFTNDDVAVERCTQFVALFLNEFAHGCSEHWNRRKGLGGFLCTNNGISALLRCLGEALAYELQRRNLKEPWRLSPGELLDYIKYLGEPIIEYFNTADEAAVMREFRQRDYGSSGYKNSAMRVMALVHAKYPNFEPEGLKEFLAQSEEGNIELARNLVSEIEKCIRAVTFRVLDDGYGGSVDDWWRPAVPQAIRQSAATRAEGSDEQGEAHEFLNLLDYKHVAENNWQHFDRVWARSVSERSKKAQLAWFDELNPIRNRLSHSGRQSIKGSELEWLQELASHVSSR